MTPMQSTPQNLHRPGNREACLLSCGTDAIRCARESVATETLILFEDEAGQKLHTGVVVAPQHSCTVPPALTRGRAQ
ncbi:hypothetical protein BJN34_33625 [Cupriavidus necator]|uniref:Uncharacterized protein n=1 Tax=Cupriavidus necator TaxID=106590 RepID=A0A1U9V1L6_CUPNE|nr:hypothetical protein BJN34_33625 [Cupriavidus necator]